MPIYEYSCQACGQTADIMQKISDPPETDCPACGKPALQKLVSAAGFRLSGGGWYETDFKSGNKKNVSAGEKADSGGSCTPTGCDKPACAAKADAPSTSAGTST